MIAFLPYRTTRKARRAVVTREERVFFQVPVDSELTGSPGPGGGRPRPAATPSRRAAAGRAVSVRAAGEQAHWQAETQTQTTCTLIVQITADCTHCTSTSTPAP
jgi:hypothetical protein